MTKHVVLTGVLMDHEVCLSWMEVCQIYQIEEKQLEDILEHGLLSSVKHPIKKAHFDLTMLHRIRRALRLQHDLELNASGSVLVLELLDHIDQLKAQLRVLSHHVLDQKE